MTTNVVQQSISLCGIMLLVGMAVPVARLFAFSFVPWPYAFFPLLVWIVSVVVRVVRAI